MKLAHRPLLLALLTLLCSSAALANDAPAAEEKKDDKAPAHAAPELPSKPYPKNVTPKAFTPRVELKKAEEAATKAAEKPAEKKADAAADAHGDHSPAKLAKHEPAHDKPAHGKRSPAAPAAKPQPVKDPALAAVAGEALAQGKTGGVYQVKSRESLDSVIRKTMPDSPFSIEVMREAFARANPQLLADQKNLRLKSGTTLKLPGADELRQVVLGEPAAAPKPATNLHAEAPVLAPTMHAADTERNLPLTVPRQAAALAEPEPEAPADDKRRWVRYP